MQKISITVDVEQDCPPMLDSMHGIEEGLPDLLKLFREERIRATFFSTGRVAELYPDRIKRVVDEGHELGCHGYLHERFDHLSREKAEDAINRATEILGEFDNIVSFRAPNFKFPSEYIKILANNGYKVDSSLACYKPHFRKSITSNGKIVRVPASITSSVLRLPVPIVLPLLSYITNPVLFVHPWEFVDLSNYKIRFDCKFNTGTRALNNLKNIIEYFKLKGYEFITLKNFAKNPQ